MLFIHRVNVPDEGEPRLTNITLHIHIYVTRRKMVLIGAFFLLFLVFVIYSILFNTGLLLCLKLSNPHSKGLLFSIYSVLLPTFSSILLLSTNYYEY